MLDKAMHVVRIQRLSRIKRSPLKDELVYYGEAITSKLHMEVLDNGTDVKLTFLIPARQPKEVAPMTYT